jgi:hypothetical protein
MRDYLMDLLGVVAVAVCSFVWPVIIAAIL